MIVVYLLCAFYHQGSLSQQEQLYLLQDLALLVYSFEGVQVLQIDLEDSGWVLFLLFFLELYIFAIILQLYLKAHQFLLYFAPSGQLLKIWTARLLNARKILMQILNNLLTQDKPISTGLMLEINLQIMSQIGPKMDLHQHSMMPLGIRPHPTLFLFVGELDIELAHLAAVMGVLAPGAVLLWWCVLSASFALHFHPAILLTGLIVGVLYLWVLFEYDVRTVGVIAQDSLQIVNKLFLVGVQVHALAEYAPFGVCIHFLILARHCGHHVAGFGQRKLGKQVLLG